MLDSNRREVLHVAPFVSFNTTKKRQKMTKDDFTSKLHALNLSKKEFAKLCDLSYSTDKIKKNIFTPNIPYPFKIYFPQKQVSYSLNSFSLNNKPCLLCNSNSFSYCPRNFDLKLLFTQSRLIAFSSQAFINSHSFG